MRYEVRLTVHPSPEEPMFDIYRNSSEFRELVGFAARLFGRFVHLKIAKHDDHAKQKAVENT